jgi:hypothetical protein
MRPSRHHHWQSWQGSASICRVQPSTRGWAAWRRGVVYGLLRGLQRLRPRQPIEAGQRHIIVGFVLAIVGFVLAIVGFVLTIVRFVLVTVVEDRRHRFQRAGRIIAWCNTGGWRRHAGRLLDLQRHEHVGQ